MGVHQLQRITRVLTKIRTDLDDHACACGDRVLGIALHPDDHAELGLVEMFGLPVLAWDEVERGVLKMLCEAEGRLIPRVETAEELLEHCTYSLRPPDSQDSSLAA